MTQKYQGHKSWLVVILARLRVGLHIEDTQFLPMIDLLVVHGQVIE